MAITRLITKVRDLIHDDYEPGYDIFSFVSSKVFTLSEASIQESSLKCYVNDTLIVNTSADVKYTFDSDTNKVTFDNTFELTAGDVIEFRYQCYKQYTDNEVTQYIHSSIIRLSTAKYQTFVLRDDNTIFPTPVESDENLIALIASILMEGNLARYRTPEVELEFAKDEDNESRITRSIRQFNKTYGNIDYHNIRRPYTMYVEDSDMTLENLP